MISQSGDKRAALIAALISIPAACLVTMVIHTFVPIPKQNVVTAYAFWESGGVPAYAADDAPAAEPEKPRPPEGEFRKGHGPKGEFCKGHGPKGEFRRGHGPEGEFRKGHGPKGEFCKGHGPKGEFRRGHGPKGALRSCGCAGDRVCKDAFSCEKCPRGELVKKIAALAEQRYELLKKDAGASPRELVRAEADLLLSRAALQRCACRARPFGPAAADLAVRTVAARKIAALDKAALAAKKIRTDAALKSEIAALTLELQLNNMRISANAEWRKALEAYRAKPGADTLKALIAAEENAGPGFLRRR
ncbi:MAG: hypothetical protein IJU70_03845 [Lentisphaeria bacterium]|nr:hypothetical protein [Lentisphaeria bacterium]